MKPRKLKIRVGIPSYSGRLFPETAKTIELLSDFKAIDFQVFIVPGQERAQARNIAVSGSNCARRQVFDFDYYLSMDNDNSLESPDAVFSLLEHKKDIVSAAYHIRSSIDGALRPRFCASFWGETPGLAPVSGYLSDETRGLVKVDTIGLGCALISRKVFETMEYPYFRLNTVFTEKNGYLSGDDLSFCMNAAAAGFEIWVDCDTISRHNPANDYR